MRFIRNLERYIPSTIEQNTKYYLAAPINDRSNELLNRIGFSVPFINGETVVPVVSLNRATLINAEGKTIVRKDLPMETISVQRSMEAPNWNNDGTHTVTWNHTYNRYVREQLLPEEVELKLIMKNDGTILIVSELLIKTEEKTEHNKMAVNLFRYLFNNFLVLNKDLSEIPSIKKMSWELLRPGKYSKEEIKTIIHNHCYVKNEKKREIINKRLDLILNHSDENLIAIGTNGFDGYVCFKTKNFYVLESRYTNNATYLLNDNWEQISKLTKQEVINNCLAEDRIYHTSNWEEKINKTL